MARLLSHLQLLGVGARGHGVVVDNAGDKAVRAAPLDQRDPDRRRELERVAELLTQRSGHGVVPAADHTVVDIGDAMFQHTVDEQVDPASPRLDVYRDIYNIWGGGQNFDQYRQRAGCKCVQEDEPLFPIFFRNLFLARDTQNDRRQGRRRARARGWVGGCG